MSLYRQYFTPTEIAALDAACAPDDLLSEINLLRVLLSRLLAASQRAHDLTLQQHAAILSACSASGMVLAALMRLQYKLHPWIGGLLAAIAAGEELARRQHHVYSYLDGASPLTAPA